MNPWRKHSSLPDPMTQNRKNYRYPPPAHYTDTNGKAWIIFLLYPIRRDDSNSDTTDKNISSSSTEYDSYLYDMENDKFIPFIKNYKKDINNKFNITHAASHGRISFVVDSKETRIH